MDYQQNVDIAKKSSRQFIIEVIIFAGIAIIAFQVWSRFNPTTRATINTSKQENSIAADRYEVLKERFKTPQKVIGVENLDAIVFEGGVYVALLFNTQVANDTSKRQEVEQFIKNNLIGQEVTVIMPTKNAFIAGYCCRNQNVDDPSIPQSVKDSEHFFGQVYFNGELLNEKFGYYQKTN